MSGGTGTDGDAGSGFRLSNIPEKRWSIHPHAATKVKLQLAARVRGKSDHRHFGIMCSPDWTALPEIDWKATADWITAVGTGATAVIALFALRAWRTQLRGSNKHAAAQDIEIAALNLRYALEDARAPFIWAGEFPREYYDIGPGQQRTAEQTALGYDHVYRNRWNDLWPHIRAFAKFRPRAGAVLGDAVADAVEALARKARELRFLQEEDVKYKSVGPQVVAGYGDQEFVKRVKASVLAGRTSKDPLSVEFADELRKLRALLKPYIA
jgi:hypothetical protein